MHLQQDNEGSTMPTANRKSQGTTRSQRTHFLPCPTRSFNYRHSIKLIQWRKLNRSAEYVHCSWNVQRIQIKYLKRFTARGKWQLYEACNSDKSRLATLGNSSQFPKLSSYYISYFLSTSWSCLGVLKNNQEYFQHNQKHFQYVPLKKKISLNFDLKFIVKFLMTNWYLATLKKAEAGKI